MIFIHRIHVNFPTPYHFEALSDIDNESISIGNKQLPKEMSTFMFTPKIVELCRLVLNRHCIKRTRSNDNNEVSMGIKSKGDDNVKRTEDVHGYLLIQSNVEDVACTMKNMVLSHTRQHCDEKVYDGNDFILPDDNLLQHMFEYLTDDDKDISENKSTETTTTTATDEKDDGKDYMIQKRTSRWIASGGERAEGPHNGWIPHHRRLLPPYARTETEAMCNVFGKPVHRIVFAIRSYYH